MKCMVGVKKQSISSRKLKVLGIFILFYCLSPGLSAQQQEGHILGKSIYELRTESFQQIDIKFPTYPLYFSEGTLLSDKPFEKITSPKYTAPKLYAYEDLAFFCRLEVKMDKASKMPVRFRLGSVDYVNRLEGKY